MAEPADIRCSVGPLTISNRHFNYLQILFCGAKQQIEISKRIEVTEVFSIFSDSIVIATTKDFRPAKCIFDRLSQKVAQQKSKEFIA